MSDGIVVSYFTNLQSVEMALIQIGRSYLVTDKLSLSKECKHDKGFTLVKVESDLYGYACNSGCGHVLSFSPDQFPDGVAHVKHEPSPEDKVVKLATGGKY